MSDSGKGPVQEEFTDDFFEGIRDMTVQDLIDMYGEEATKRGIQYISSLSDAQDEYRQSTGGYAEGMARRHGIDEEELGQQVGEATKKWADKMEERGLGLD